MFEKISDIEEPYYAWALHEKGRAKSTVAKHRDSIRVFKRIVGDVPVRRISMDHFDHVRAELYENSRAYVASVIYTMRSFLQYCQSKGYKVIDPSMVKVPPQKRNPVVKVLTRDEIERIIDGIGIYNQPRARSKSRTINLYALRWKCLMAVMWSSGMRISEALSLNWEDVSMDRREAIIRGKGGKYRKVFFNQSAIDIIKEYLNVRLDDHEALFVAHKKEVCRWGFSAAQCYLERWRKKLDIKKHITFHTIRKTFASVIFYEKDIYAASKLLGHSNIRTTQQHYIAENWEQLREIHQAALERVI